ncbi:MRPL23 [Auxenochlorella protothecoides x Auxenochlorella symbiontica]
MSWRRLQAALPNLTLKLYPLSKAQQAIYETTGTVKELVFRTTPKANKAEIKEHLEKVYGLSVEKVNTCNYLGRKKHGKAGFYRRPDYKKAFVFLKEGSPKAASQ